MDKALMDAFDAAVREAAGWLPRTRVYSASLTVPTPEAAFESYRVRKRTYRRNVTKSAWPDACVRCGTLGTAASSGWPASAEAVYGNGCLVGVRATLPAARRWVRELSRIVPGGEFREEALRDSDGRPENARIRASKPWRRLSWLLGACSQCEWTTRHRAEALARLAAARADGRAFLPGIGWATVSEVEKMYGYLELPPYVRDSA